MEVSELRIGNWVQMNNKPVQMDAKMFHAVIHGFEGYQPAPIPLTFEMVITAGFVEKTEHFSSAGNVFEKRKDPYTILRLVGIAGKKRSGVSLDYHAIRWVCAFVHDMKAVYVTTFNGVHEFQNLYFALNKEEIKLELL